MVKKFQSYIVSSFCIFVSLVSPTQAAWWSTSNLQVLYGTGFDDRFFGNYTEDEKLTTVKFEHYNRWSYGDNFLFVDYNRGDFVNFIGQPVDDKSRIYGEWIPRLSLSKLINKSLKTGAINDLFVAGQINRSDEDYEAYLLGLGSSLNVLGSKFFRLDVYRKKDDPNGYQWQLTTAWIYELKTIASGLTFEGFMDFATTKNNGIDINGRPKIMYDVGRSILLEQDRLGLGFELYIHRNNDLNTYAPEAVIRLKF